MRLKHFLILSGILFALGLGAIFLVNRLLQIDLPNATHLPALQTKAPVIFGWSTYVDTVHAFTIQRPTNAQITVFGPQLLSSGAEQVLHISTALDTTIGDLPIARADDPIIGVDIYMSADTTNCLTFLNSSSTAVLINAVPFKTATSSDAAMGGERGLTREYRTLHNNICFILKSTVHYRDIAFLTGVTGDAPHTASPTELEQQARWIDQQQRLHQQIIKTFSFSQ